MLGAGNVTIVKNPEQGVKYLNKTIELNPNFANAYAYRAESQFNSSLGLEGNEKVFNDLSKAIQLKPKCIAYRYCRANYYFMIKEFKLAIEDYNKVIELQPKFIEAYHKLSYLYESLGDNEKAQQYIDMSYAAIYDWT